MTTEPSRRIKSLRVDSDLLVSLLKDLSRSRIAIIGGQIPDDATVVALERGSYTSRDYNAFYILIHSESFPEVPAGEIFPEHVQTYTRSEY